MKKQYALIKRKIEAGEITQFNELFQYVSPEELAADMREDQADFQPDPADSQQYAFWFHCLVKGLDKKTCLIIAFLAMMQHDESE